MVAFGIVDMSNFIENSKSAYIVPHYYHGIPKHIKTKIHFGIWTFGHED